MPAGVIDIAIVGDPVDPSPLKDKLAIAALISSCVPLKPNSATESPLQSVGSDAVSYTHLTLPTKA